MFNDTLYEVFTDFFRQINETKDWLQDVYNSLVQINKDVYLTSRKLNGFYRAIVITSLSTNYYHFTLQKVHRNYCDYKSILITNMASIHGVFALVN